MISVFINSNQGYIISIFFVKKNFIKLTYFTRFNKLMTDDLTRKFLKEFINKQITDKINPKKTAPGTNKEITIETISEPALDILLDSIFLAVKRVSIEAMRISEYANRTEVNAYDMIEAFDVFRESIETFAKFEVNNGIQVNQPRYVESYPIIAKIDDNENENMLFPYRTGSIVEFFGTTQSSLPPHIPQYFPAFSDFDFVDVDLMDTDITCFDEKCGVSDAYTTGVSVKIECALIKDIISSINVKASEAEGKDVDKQEKQSEELQNAPLTSYQANGT